MQSTPESPLAHEAFVGQIRSNYAHIVYQQKTHEKQAQICVKSIQRVKFLQIALSALTTCALLAVLISAPKIGHPALIVATLASMALLAVNAYLKDIDPSQSAQRHLKTANDLWSIKESYLSLLTDLHDGTLSHRQAELRRDELQLRLSRIFTNALRTSPKAFRQACDDLLYQDPIIVSDKDINHFLPQDLHRHLAAQANWAPSPLVAPPPSSPLVDPKKPVLDLDLAPPLDLTGDSELTSSFSDTVQAHEDQRN